MRFATFISLLIFFAGLPIARGQDEGLLLCFKPAFLKADLDTGVEYHLNNQSVKIETFRFYVSNISFIKKGKPVWKEANNYHLVDASDKSSWRMMLNVPSSVAFDNIQFTLGIDSLTNVSGVMGGDLDPTKGMYWTWQSGYVNFKLEGSSPVCRTRNNLFGFHLGGYMPPYASFQKVILKVMKADTLYIRADVAEFLKQIDLSETHHVMSTGKEAQKLSQLAASIFYYDEDR